MTEIADKMAELAERFGPTVIDATRAAARTEAYSTLVGGIVALGWAAGLTYVAHWGWKKAHADDDELSGYWIIFGCFLAAALVSGGVGFWQIIDPWVWVTMSNPDAWIAKKFLLK